MFKCLELTVPGVGEKKSEKVESWRMYKVSFVSFERRVGPSEA